MGSQSELPEELSTTPSPRLKHASEPHFLGWKTSEAPDPEPAGDALLDLGALMRGVLTSTCSHAVSDSALSKPLRASQTC